MCYDIKCYLICVGSTLRYGSRRSSLPTVELVENFCGPQTRSHVFGFGGGVNAKDLKGGTSSKSELLYVLRSTRKDIKSLNGENNSLNDRLSTHRR